MARFDQRPAEGEEEQVIRAANTFLAAGLGQPVLIGREEKIRKTFEDSGIGYRDDIAIVDPREAVKAEDYSQFLHGRLQRDGYMVRDCNPMVNNDRNVFGACMVAMAMLAIWPATFSSRLTSVLDLLK